MTYFANKLVLYMFVFYGVGKSYLVVLSLMFTEFLRTHFSCSVLCVIEVWVLENFEETPCFLSPYLCPRVLLSVL